MTDCIELKRLAVELIAVNDLFNESPQDNEVGDAWSLANDHFTEAASPEVILALIAENQRLEGLALDSVNTEFAEQLDFESICAERDQLKAEAESLRQVMSAVVAEIPGAHTSRSGNAPGHCHSIPGVWDRDNGAKAGKECAWCKLWNYAAAMGKGEQS